MARQRKEPTPVRIVLDEDIGSETLRDAMLEEARTRAASVELLIDVLGRRGAADSEWLPTAGEQGWAVVTHDVRQKRRDAEREIIMTAGVSWFVLRGQLNGDQIRAALVAAVDAICRRARTLRPPFICHIDRDGNVTVTMGERRGGRRKTTPP